MSFLFQRVLITLIHGLLRVLKFPTIVCLCGSTSKALDAFRIANLQETLKGKIVLTIGCDTKSDDDLFGLDEEEKLRIKKGLDALHLFKVLLAHEVLILNVQGYIGASTQRELACAYRLQKCIRFLEPEKAHAV